MQVTSTRVAPEGQTIAVEFLGEGGELVSVVMSNVGNMIDAGNAVKHAQALLAQVSTFGSETEPALNRYDALSNGTLDDTDGEPTEISEWRNAEAIPSDVEPATDYPIDGRDPTSGT